MLEAKSLLKMPMSERLKLSQKTRRKRENASEELLGHLTCGFLPLVGGSGMEGTPEGVVRSFWFKRSHFIMKTVF